MFTPSPSPARVVDPVAEAQAAARVAQMLTTAEGTAELKLLWATRSPRDDAVLLMGSPGDGDDAYIYTDTHTHTPSSTRGISVAGTRVGADDCGMRRGWRVRLYAGGLRAG